MSARPASRFATRAQLAAVDARDAHRVAVERHETRGESGRRVESSRRSRPACRRPRAPRATAAATARHSLGTELARAHERDDLAAVRADRVARRHEAVALAHLFPCTGRAAPERGAAAHVDGLCRHHEPEREQLLADGDLLARGAARREAPS